MALLVQRPPRAKVGVTKLPLCHTCRENKSGLFTIDSQGKPRCADCSALVGRPIPGA